MRNFRSLLALGVAASAVGWAQTGPISQPARAGIDAGNQAWIDGMKRGDAARIAATYAENAVDCGPAGDCFAGRTQIEKHIADRMALSGRARSASVQSWGATEQGSFVYEWGRAEAAFDGGRTLAGSYLTVWQRQPDGVWKIFRNMAIPEK
jgi:ketosteroid isomerase-like protein